MSVTCLFLANSVFAYDIGSSLFPFGIRNRFRRISRYSPRTRPRWMKASRDGGGGLFVGGRDALKVFTAARTGEGRIGDVAGLRRFEEFCGFRG